MAKGPTKPSEPRRSSKSSAGYIYFNLVQAILLTGVLSLTTYTSQLALHPLYGDTATSRNFHWVVLGSLALSGALSSIPTVWALDIITGVLLLAPWTAYVFGAWTARLGWEQLGPMMAQGGMAIPVLLLGGAAVRTHIIRATGLPKHDLRLRALLTAATYGVVRQLSKTIEKDFPRGGTMTSCNLFLGLGCFTLAICFVDVFAMSSPEHKGASGSARSGRVWAIKSVFVAVHLALAYHTKTHRPCNTPQYPLVNGNTHVLAVKQGITGLISVVDNPKDGFRYMRCDHSLLGGVWIDSDKKIAISTTRGHPSTPGGRDTFGMSLGDSIYSTFVLQDGIRLFNRDVAPKAPGQSALVIGLGVGIMARSLALSGIMTTVVEIDSVVHDFAETYFGMPRQPRVNTSYVLPPTEAQTHHMDAQTFVQRRSAELLKLGPVQENMQYDYIVHDVFSGGMVPTHLFTKEFFSDAKTLMKSNGVIAVNFAGKVKSDAARGILTTLEVTFAKCRVFHDALQGLEGAPQYSEDADEFINLVFFCSKAKTVDLTTREPTMDDYLDSLLRKHMFEHFNENEIPRKHITDGMDSTDLRYVIRNEDNWLGKWQEKTAMEHWKLMRFVLPASAWETY